MKNILTVCVFLVALLVVSVGPTACTKHPAAADPEDTHFIDLICGDEIALGDHELQRATKFMREHDVDCDARTATPHRGSAEDRYELGTGVQP